ncbi:MAG: helix-turn-helix transcriptional regulator [Candidatus Levybacteria bacterium]|nr:helix-turn-helix transcriptional regulator [Candidatus Levybacteria bacterium]
MKSWKVLREELLQDPKVRAEYEKLKPRYELISQLISARAKRGLTQAQLAKKMGTKQSAIARVEGGNVNLSIAFLEKLSRALGSKLVIRLQ